MYPKLIETSPNNFSLLLTEFKTSEPYFDALGHEGGGYDWQSIASYLLSSSASHLSEFINFDSESSMFCAYGKDQNALNELKTLLSHLIDQPAQLTEIIKQIPEHFWD